MFGLPGSVTTNMAEKCPAILLSSGVTLTNVEQWSLARQLSRQKLRGYGKENKLLRLKIPVFASRNVALNCNDISIKISSGFMLINEQRSLASQLSCKPWLELRNDLVLGQLVLSPLTGQEVVPVLSCIQMLRCHHVQWSLVWQPSCRARTQQTISSHTRTVNMWHDTLSTYECIHGLQKSKMPGFYSPFKALVETNRYYYCDCISHADVSPLYHTFHTDVCCN